MADCSKKNGRLCEQINEKRTVHLYPNKDIWEDLQGKMEENVKEASIGNKGYIW